MIPIAEPCFDRREKANLDRAIASGWISSRGEFIPRFENDFSRWCGMRYGVAVSNGTVAIHLALLALGIGPGDEVVVPSFTFCATANAVLHAGATPVFTDCSPVDWNMTPAMFEAVITKKTKAVIPVHIYGNPCDMAGIRRIARGHGIFVIEDCAESHGALIGRRMTGSFSEISCFSFYGNKVITTGEGGLCLTNGRKLYEKMRILRDHGMDPKRKYWHNIVGYNYRMTNMQAAVGCAQFEKIDRLVGLKRRLARWYGEELAGLADRGKLRLHSPREGTSGIYWLYSVVLQPCFRLERGELIRALLSSGVESRPFFNPLHLMPPYRKFVREGQRFPVAEKLGRDGLNLPSSPRLGYKDIVRISRLLKKFAERKLPG